LRTVLHTYANGWKEKKVRGNCWSCHDLHATVEHTFVQLYLTLKPVAKNVGTYNETREKAR
jgi:hypothetical protein